MEYSWSNDRRDLDTSTRFHGANDGWSCHNPSQYLKWLGDDTSYGGSEYAVVDFEQARLDGLWTDSTTVTANAGWHGSEQQGQAKLRVWLRAKGSDNLQPQGNSPSVVIHPGVQTSCSPHHVGNVKIIRGEKLTRITVEQA
ncbi:hypothetical protein FGB62_79g038 [Gracilaria domingensis]|nr:hypothetical protein FGB62_79g038 [Gracilaria domingensis]